VAPVSWEAEPAALEVERPVEVAPMERLGLGAAAAGLRPLAVLAAVALTGEVLAVREHLVVVQWAAPATAAPVVVALAVATTAVGVGAATLPLQLAAAAVHRSPSVPRRVLPIRREIGPVTVKS
jgi:hypothetical protein